MVVYVVDSNFFIEAHRANYPLDVAFSFWYKIKIPEACNHFKVRYLKTMEMLRELGETF